MQTVVVYDRNTKEVLVCIPMDGSADGLCREDIGFRIFDGADPVFSDTPDGELVFKEGAYIVNL